MAGLSKVTINVAGGGVGRRAPNEDKISGIVFWNSTIPAGFATVNKQKVLTLANAESLGITETAHELEWYHISEFFRANDEGELWIMWLAANLAPDFVELLELQTFSGGKIRQMATFDVNAFAGTEPTTIQAVIDTFPDDAPCVVLHTGDMTALTAATLTDLRILVAQDVTVVIAQDGGGQGDALATSEGISVCNVGAALGTLSSAGVQESIGHLAKFNHLSNGVEMEVLKYGTGELVSSLTDVEQGAVKNKGYLIARKYLPSVAGSYWERVPMSVVATNDYAWVEANRTIDKAIRGVSAALTPQLQSGVRLNSDGTLSDDSIGFFSDLALDPLTNMETEGEISAAEVLIDPTQDILSTSTLEVTVRIVPIAIAEFIEVTIGLVAEL
ncbi:MAG: hypothetical protein DRQ39_09535 [Gammaproteobacteria bacterium]|nr:MAG: hypothetical protein DRQ39_09535 [Gammaproteobacteria bacterium]